MNITNELLLSVVEGGKVTNGLSVVYLTEDKSGIVIEPIGDNPSKIIPFNLDTLCVWFDVDIWWNYNIGERHV